MAQEPFVSGVPETIDDLARDIPDVGVEFSAVVVIPAISELSAYAAWVREEMGGNWCKANDPPTEGWVWPALFRYFARPPTEFFVMAESEKR